MNMLSRWMTPLVLAAGLGSGAMAMPATAHADDLTRVLVDIADVVMRGGTPYYRHGDYGYDDRLYVQRDRYGRPLYYRQVPRYAAHYRSGPPYGNAHGRYRSKSKCNRNGKCRVEYYDPRYDRGRHHARYDRRHDRYWDGRRWRDDD